MVAAVALIVLAAAPAGAMCSSLDLRLDREAGPMVAFAPSVRPRPGDRERARQSLHMIREVVAPYRDLRAVAAQYAQPEVLMKGWRRAPPGSLIAVDRPNSHDDEHRPRVLLYRRTASGFALVGVQFEALSERTDAQLDDILPMSVARWHQVVRHCTAPPVWNWIATVFPFARDEDGIWRTLEFERYVRIAPHRRSRHIQSMLELSR
ncbi:MAG TPA: hypothetical protein VHS78_18575 [Candidatus Elarobacter sp.]|nr:hypothetical protein [Candidatus Elarobacter sp.]